MWTSQSQVRCCALLKAASRATGVAVIGLGGVVLIGWASGVPVLMSLWPGLVPMKANSAVAFVLSGFVLWRFSTAESEANRHRVEWIVAGLVVVIGALSLSQDLFGWRLGIDELLFREELAENSRLAPGRMAATTALGLMLVGLSLLLSSVRGGHRLSQSLALVAGLFGLLSLTSDVYGVAPVHRVGLNLQMSLPSSLAFVLLSFGILAARPARGLMAVFASDSTGGLVARRLLTAALLVPLFVGWLRLLGQQAGWYGLEFGLALFALSNMIVFAGLVFWSAHLLQLADANRQRAEEEFRQAVESAPNGMLMINREGRIVLVNTQTEVLFGYPREELLGQPVEMLVPEQFRSIHPEHRASFFANPHARSMGVGRDLYGRRKDGSEFPVEIGLNPIQTEAGVLVLSAIVDITDRKRAEEALRESQQMLALVLDNIPQAVFWKDRNSRYLGCNRVVCEALGLKNQQELIGKSDYELGALSREQAEFFIHKDQEVMRSGETEGPIIETLNRADGSTILLETTKVPLFDARGSVIGLLGNWRDITKARQAEEAVRRSEERYRSLVTAISQIVWTADAQGRIVNAGPNWELLTGLPNDRVDRDWMSVVHPDDLPGVREKWSAAATTETPYVAEFRLRRVDGEWRHMDSRSVPIRDKDGRVMEWVGVCVDVTERKRSEEAIASYNKRLTILHQIDRALISGEELATIAARALPPLRELLGVPRAIVNLFDLEKGEVEWLAAAGRRRIRVGPGVRYSIRFMGDVEALRRGELQLIDVHALPPSPEVDALLESGVHTYVVVPMIVGNELIGALSFGELPWPLSTEQENITREVATQIAIALTQARLHESVKRHTQELEVRVHERTCELEAANKELESFSYSVSHDLRAPLRAIDGFSRILQMEHTANMPAEMQDYLRDIRANTQQMGRLVDDLLAFSRLSRQPLNKQPVEPTDMVRQCLDELLRPQDGRKVEIRLEELPECWADPPLLKQVWINLISNALKYSSKRDTAVIEIGSRDGDVAGQRTYFIKDNGVGFDMRYVHKLFNVFQRLHRADEYEGTGVGLAIVQRVIHRHGGRVWAESVLDQEATFSFTLEHQRALS